MAELVLHPANLKLLAAYKKTPAHALLLSGPIGSGTGTVAKEIAHELTGKKSVVTVIEPEKGTIPIDRIRLLYEQTRSIQQGKRCIVIDDADAMSTDAQNALLKLLEEPVENVHFILTTHQPTRLLPTITSRTQHIALLPLDEKTSRALLEKHDLEAARIVQAMFLASGRPAELVRLASDSKYFDDQAAVVTDARALLQSDAYTRLTILKKYTDRTAALHLLEMCARLLTFMLYKQRNYASAEVMEILDRVIRRIEGNGHVRTQLAYLVTKLP